MNTEPITIGQVVLAIGILVTIAIGLKTLMVSNRAQKRDVTLIDNPVSQPEHQGLVKRMDKVEITVEAIRADMRRDRIEIDAANEDRASRLHQRIDALAEDVADMPVKVAAHLRTSQGLFNTPPKS